MHLKILFELVPLERIEDDSPVVVAVLDQRTIRREEFRKQASMTADFYRRRLAKESTRSDQEKKVRLALGSDADMKLEPKKYLYDMTSDV